jgi:hypothetical protein
MSKQRDHLKKISQARSRAAQEKNYVIAQSVRGIRIDNPNLSLREISDMLSISYAVIYASYKKCYPEDVSVNNNGKRGYGHNSRAHNKRQSIQDNQLEKVKHLYHKKLLTLKQIGEGYSCTAGAVLNFFKKHQITRRTNSEASILVWTDEKKEQARQRGVTNYISANKIDTGPELRFKEWASSNNLSYIPQYRRTGIPHPYDFLIPSLNLLVEIDGTYWHGFPNQVVKDQEHVRHATSCGYNIVRVDASEAMKEKYDFSKWIFKDDKWTKTFQNLVTRN